MTNVIKQLNQLQADAHALFVAFHAYHWNVKGMQFPQIHAYTDEAYEEMGTLFDDMAERAIMVGGKAITCVQTLRDTAKAPKEIKDEYTPTEVLKNVEAAYKYLVEEFKKLDELASKAGDQTSSNIAQDKVADLEKKLWFLKNTLA